MTHVMTRAVFAVILLGWPAVASTQDRAASPADKPAGACDVAADKPGVNAPGQRFRFSKAGDGLLRLDGETGQISYCSARTIGWSCQAVPEERAALETEIARLQDKVEALTREIADLHASDSAAAAPRPPEPVPPSKSGELKLSSRVDLDRAREHVLTFLDDAWRRLIDMFEQWLKDMRRT